MMPIVIIPEPIYKRLQAIAVPFEDTPITVIERLLNEYEARCQPNDVDDIEDIIEDDDDIEDIIEDDDDIENILDPDNPDNLRHTRVMQAVIGDIEIRQPHWNRIVGTIHLLALRQGLSMDDLIKLTLSNVVKGEKNTCGFRYFPEANISVQSVDANTAWRNTLYLAKKLKVQVGVSFKWLDKKGAAYPGEKGQLFWMPK